MNQTINDVRDNIVKVIDGEGRFGGTAFFLQEELCITCHHCIYWMDKISVARANKRYPAAWVKELSDMERDIAILRIKGSNFRPLQYAKEAMPGLDVRIWGFPGNELEHFPGGNVVQGKLYDTTSAIQFPTPPDYSPGPREWNKKPNVNLSVYTLPGKFDLGYSGAPVCYHVNSKVVGMFNAKDPNYGFVLPIELIVEKISVRIAAPSIQDAQTKLQSTFRPKKKFHYKDGPHLTYRNGPLIESAQIFTVFWGLPWVREPYLGLAEDLNNFFKSLLTESQMNSLGEYDVPSKYAIGKGYHLGTCTLTEPAPESTVTDKIVRDLIHNGITVTKMLPHANINTVFFIYLPPGTDISASGATSSQTFCAYHNNIDGKVCYAVIVYPMSDGCLRGQSVIDALTTSSSHKLWETITDPVPGQGWYDQVHGEIGDMCAFQTKKMGKYTVQLRWSNKNNSCV